MYPPKCCIAGCNEQFETGIRTYHRFPSDERTRQVWIQITAKSRYQLEENPDLAVCSKHFAPFCFEIKNGITHLKKGAIPIRSFSDNLPVINVTGSSQNILTPFNPPEDLYGLISCDRVEAGGLDSHSCSQQYEDNFSVPIKQENMTLIDLDTPNGGQQDTISTQYAYIKSEIDNRSVPPKPASLGTVLEEKSDYCLDIEDKIPHNLIKCNQSDNVQVFKVLPSINLTNESHDFKIPLETDTENLLNVCTPRIISNQSLALRRSQRGRKCAPKKPRVSDVVTLNTFGNQKSAPEPAARSVLSATQTYTIVNPFPYLVTQNQPVFDVTSYEPPDKIFVIDSNYNGLQYVNGHLVIVSGNTIL